MLMLHTTAVEDTTQRSSTAISNVCKEQMQRRRELFPGAPVKALRGEGREETERARSPVGPEEHGLIGTGGAIERRKLRREIMWEMHKVKGERREKRGEKIEILQKPKRVTGKQTQKLAESMYSAKK
eukprot:RCo002349